MKLKQITACLVAATMFGSNPVFAQSAPKVSGDVIKIGVLTDLSSTYSDLAGPGAVIDFLMPSIQPQHRDSITTSSQDTLGIPDFFLNNFTHNSLSVA